MESNFAQVKCPECGHDFNVEDVISHQAEERALAKLEQRDREAQSRIAAKEQELNAKEAEILKSKGQIELEVQTKLAAEKDALRKQLKQQLETEQQAALSTLQEELAAKSKETATLKAKELQLEKEKRALEEKQRDLDAEVADKMQAAQNQFALKEQAFAAKEAELSKSRTQMELDLQQKLAAKDAELLKAKNQVDLEVQQKLATEKASISKEIKAVVEAEQAEAFKALQEEIEAKSKEASALKAKELELMKEKRTLEEKQRDFDTEVQKKVLEGQAEIEARIRKQEQDAAYMKLKEEEKKSADLRDQIEELKRKAQQGSMQSQGEIQEIELEKILRDSFRFDHFVEVKKGASGADLVQEVTTRLGKKAGNIAWESKRTKAFSETWIPKLKEDMMRHKAEIGVIVTEAMPADMPHFGLRDGIWICTFHEAVAIAAILRESLLKLADVRDTEHNKGEKAQLLYDYIMSLEFQQQIRAIVEGFSRQKQLLEQERKVMTKIWKEREKSIDSIILNAVSMEGAIQGIAGTGDDDLLQLEAKYSDSELA